jgi:hypothetical protein
MSLNGTYHFCKQKNKLSQEKQAHFKHRYWFEHKSRNFRAAVAWYVAILISMYFKQTKKQLKTGRILMTSHFMAIGY